MRWKAAADAVYDKFHRARNASVHLQLIGMGHDGRIGSLNACQAIISGPGIEPDDKADRGERPAAERLRRTTGEYPRSGGAFRGVNEEYRHCRAGLLPQGRRLPMGLSGPHAGPRIHPADRAGALLRRLHDQLEVERVSGNSRPHLRPSVRAGLPARARRERAGGDLPPEARRRRLQGRRQRAHAEAGGAQERQARRAGRRRSGLADGGARSRAARLPLRGVRRRPQSRRHDPHADPQIPPARQRDRRGMRLHPRPRRRVPRRHAHRQPEGAARRRLGRGVRRLRRAARARPRHSRPPGSGQEHPYRHRLAELGVVRPHHQDRQARGRARRRQHRHGLLPLGAPPRRRGGRRGRALGLRGDEGVALGKGRRAARGHPDPQLTSCRRNSRTRTASSPASPSRR